MYTRENKSKIAGSITLVAGIWLMVSAFVMGFGIASNVFVVGLLVIIFSLVELSSFESMRIISWVNGTLGAWLLVSPLVFAGMVSLEIWNSIILGIIIAGTAVWGGMSSKIGMGHPKMG